MSAVPTLGIIVGLPIAAILIAASIVFMRLGVLMRRKPEKGYSDNNFNGRMMWWVAFSVLIITVITTACATFPWAPAYHTWVPVAGEVQEINKRQLSNMSERYVFTIDGQPYGVDDSRATTVRVGDHVELMCKKEYEWAANNGYGCRWGGSGE